MQRRRQSSGRRPSPWMARYARQPQHMNRKRKARAGRVLPAAISFCCQLAVDESLEEREVVYLDLFTLQCEVSLAANRADCQHVSHRFADLGITT